MNQLSHVALAAALVLSFSGSARADIFTSDEPVSTVEKHPAPPAPTHRLPYQLGGAIPPGYHVESGPRPWLLATGGILFGLSYGIAVAGSTGGCSSNRWMLVPVVGPFEAAEGYGGPQSGACYDHEGWKSGWAHLDGDVQVIGAGFLVAAIFFPKREVVRDEYPTATGATWRVAPTISPTTAGIAVVGAY